MVTSTEYSSGERFWLSCLAVLGFVGVNGAFLYGVIRPEVLAGALSNPVSLAFVVEALLLLIVLAYLLTKWGVLRMHWSWFVLLSLIGSLAFALPVALLWHNKRTG